MKTYKETNLARLNSAYEAAKDAGKAHNAAEFASLTDTNRSFLSQMLNGAVPVTDRTLQRIEDALAKAGVTINAHDQSQVVATGDNYGEQKILSSDERWFDLVAKKDEQIDRLLGIIEQMQK